jgi:Spy/CpxP family protein refolding chaperone
MFRPAFGAALGLMASTPLIGCATVVSSPVPATAVSGVAVDDDDLIADLNEHHRHHHHGGVTMFVAMSLDTLGLPPEQRAAVSKIQADLFARMEPARLGAQAVITALADGLAAGTIDKAKVDAAIAQAETASGAVHDATVDALNQLHAALTPQERAALVEKVAAHWAVYRQANAEEEPGGKDHRTGHLAELAAQLGLSADQVDKISTSFRASMQAAKPWNPGEVDTHVQRLEAFKADTFDAHTLTGGTAANAHLAARGATRMARFYEAMDPVLTPEQRAKLVLLLREHATHKDDAAGAAH